MLGLDPGLTCAGYGVVDQKDGRLVVVDHGAIRTTPAEGVPARLADLYLHLTELIGRFEPEGVAVERVLFNSNARTAMSVGQAAGIALLAAAQAGCEVAEYTPNEVKMSVTGYGGADKRQVQQMVTRLLAMDEPPRPADAADALGLAITHLHARRLRVLAKEAIDSA